MVLYKRCYSYLVYIDLAVTRHWLPLSGLTLMTYDGADDAIFVDHANIDAIRKIQHAVLVDSDT